MTNKPKVEEKKSRVRISWKPFLELGGITDPKRVRAGTKILNRLFNQKIDSATQRAREDLIEEIVEFRNSFKKDSNQSKPTQQAMLSILDELLSKLKRLFSPTPPLKEKGRNK